MQVICISGKAQHGKDTTAGIVKNLLEYMDHKVLIMHYADLLKYICKTYFGWDGNKDDKGRTLLQYVGTDVVRAKDPEYWAKFVLNFLKLFKDEWEYVLIPDCRFPNEIMTFMGELPVVHWRVTRPNFKSPLSEEQQNHPSEIALDDFPANELIVNDGSLDDLIIKLSTLVQDYLDNT